MLFRFLAVVLLSVSFATASALRAQPPPGKGMLVLDSRVTLVVDRNEPGPVLLAAGDLASDLEKVFGVTPPIVADRTGSGPSRSGVTLLIGEASLLPEADRPAGLAGSESFSIAVRAPSTVVLAGADMRGTLYAIYQFSQDFLGVDPLYYWTDHQPARRSRIELSGDLVRTDPPPVFNYRGFFINDEDLLTAWAPGDKDHTGISLAVWNKLYESILRLKGNMVVPGTWIFPDDPQIKLAGERGLIVTQNHANLLGLNVARWPRDVPYNFITHPDILERAWKDAVAEYPPGQEILWDVGLRGLSDTSYASMDPSVRNNDRALGALIGEAIRVQMGIVRAVHPHAHFVTNLWEEGARLVHQGYLHIPPGVVTVWADAGHGYLLDKGQVAAGDGAYYHVAMYSNRANQLSEMVPVERIVSELGRYVKAGATQYLLLNTSSFRPVTMTARAVMELAWLGHLPGTSNEDPAAASVHYFRQWSADEFGEKAAPALAKVYEAYFAAPPRIGRPPREYGDELYHTEGRQMMLAWMIDSPLYTIPSQAPKWVMPGMVRSGYGRAGELEWLRKTADEEDRACGEAQPRWDAVWRQAVAAEPLVPAARRPFYQAGVLTMIAINRESNRMLLAISKSIEADEKGDADAARRQADAALDAVEQVRQAQAAAEYDKWKHWYRGDWLTDVYRTQQVIQDYRRFLDDPLGPLPPPILWNGWEAYYHIMRYEGDRTADVN